MFLIPVMKSPVLICFLVLVQLVSGSNTLLAQAPVLEEKFFDMYIAGIKIGEMRASRETRDDVVTYHHAGKVSVWLLFRITVENSMTAVYENGILKSSQVFTRSNKGDFYATVLHKGDHYAVSVDAHDHKSDTVLHTVIRHDVCKNYFEQPRSRQPILANAYGVMVPANYVADGVLEMDVLGNKNKFYYKEGILEKVLMQSRIKNYEIRLRQ